MFTLHWFYSTPETRDSGDMPLETITLEDAKVEALRLAGQWGWTARGKKRFVGCLSIYERDKRLTYWDTLDFTWYDLEV